VPVTLLGSDAVPNNGESGYPPLMSGTFDDLRAALRERVHIADLLQACGVTLRLNVRGGGTALSGVPWRVMRIYVRV
jgi:hypothetical protein